MRPVPCYPELHCFSVVLQEFRRPQRPLPFYWFFWPEQLETMPIEKISFSLVSYLVLFCFVFECVRFVQKPGGRTDLSPALRSLARNIKPFRQRLPSLHI